MAGPTGNERSQLGADIAAAARDRGMEQLENAKGQLEGAKGRLADEAERVASAVDRTADEIESEGESAISGFGHSVASLMRQLSGGLRERDVDEFARELGALARRNPGLFLAGSVALGFGVARFFKARAPQSADYGWRGADEWQDAGGWQDGSGRGGWRNGGDDAWRGAGEQSWRGAEGVSGRDGDLEDSLDLSASSTSTSSGPSDPLTAGAEASTRSDERSSSKQRQGAKSKAKPQRASSAAQDPGEAAAPFTEPGTGGTQGGTGDDAAPGGTSGTARGGK